LKNVFSNTKEHSTGTLELPATVRQEEVLEVFQKGHSASIQLVFGSHESGKRLPMLGFVCGTAGWIQWPISH
jgi:hypothetical protein